jgi:type IV pilus biogenesis protein CpaD/CtpE
MRLELKRLAAMPAVFAIGLSTLLPGCAQTDPYKREGMWQPVGANAINLAAMLDKPSDLVRGRGTRGFPAIEASPPVVGYWSGRVAPLPNGSSTAAASGPASAPPPASANGGGS